MSRNRSNAHIRAMRRVSCMLAACVLSIPVVIGGTVLAQTEPAPEIENSPYTFAGEVNTDGAVLRSGPSESDYATQKLNVGDRLTVVGVRFDWLKVIPPEGSFCLVPQAFVERSGDGTVGRVGANPATVRIGSSITQQRHKVPLRLDPGSPVKILGTVDEFYRIVPPPGVYLYVEKKSVNPVRRLDEAQPNPAPANPAPTNPAPANPAPVTPAPVTTEPVTPNPATTSSTPTAPVESTTVANPPTVEPAPSPANAVAPNPESTVSASAPTTATAANSAPGGRFVISSDGTQTFVPDPASGASTPPAVTDPAAPANGGVSVVTPAPIADPNARPTRVVVESLQQLEIKYADASVLPIDQQPIDEMLAEYNAILAEPNLPPASRQIAEFRAQTLSIRAEALASVRATLAAQQQVAVKQQDLTAEQVDLEQRVAQTSVTQFVAVGRLAVSSLQIGNETLYRLVDPANSRLVIYVRTNNPNFTSMLDQFVGIQGEVVADPSIKLTYVTPTEVKPVDPADVNTKVFATHTPPSLITKPVQ